MIEFLIGIGLGALIVVFHAQLWLGITSLWAKFKEWRTRA